MSASWLQNVTKSSLVGIADSSKHPAAVPIAMVDDAAWRVEAEGGRRMIGTARERVAARAMAERLAAVRSLAQAERRRLRALVDETLADLIEKRGRARSIGPTARTTPIPQDARRTTVIRRRRAAPPGRTSTRRSPGLGAGRHPPPKRAAHVMHGGRAGRAGRMAAPWPEMDRAAPCRKGLVADPDLDARAVGGGPSHSPS